VLVINGHSDDTKKKLRHKNSNNAPKYSNRQEWRASGPGAFLANFLYMHIGQLGHIFQLSCGRANLG
jgi:hypothetical protein